jgi:hypothetical protein
MRRGNFSWACCDEWPQFFQGLGPNAIDLDQILDRLERTELASVLNDPIRQHRANARQCLKLPAVGRIDVNQEQHLTAVDLRRVGSGRCTLVRDNDPILIAKHGCQVQTIKIRIRDGATGGTDSIVDACTHRKRVYSGFSYSAGNVTTN